MASFVQTASAWVEEAVLWRLQHDHRIKNNQPQSRDKFVQIVQINDAHTVMITDTRFTVECFSANELPMTSPLLRIGSLALIRGGWYVEIIPVVPALDPPKIRVCVETLELMGTSTLHTAIPPKVEKSLTVQRWFPWWFEMYQTTRKKGNATAQNITTINHPAASSSLPLGDVEALFGSGQKHSVAASTESSGCTEMNIQDICRGVNRAARQQKSSTKGATPNKASFEKSQREEAASSSMGISNMLVDEDDEDDDATADEDIPQTQVSSEATTVGNTTLDSQIHTSLSDSPVATGTLRSKTTDDASLHKVAVQGEQQIRVPSKDSAGTMTKISAAKEISVDLESSERSRYSRKTHPGARKSAPKQASVQPDLTVYNEVGTSLNNVEIGTTKENRAQRKSAPTVTSENQGSVVAATNKSLSTSIKKARAKTAPEFASLNQLEDVNRFPAKDSSDKNCTTSPKKVPSARKENATTSPRRDGTTETTKENEEFQLSDSGSDDMMMPETQLPLSSISKKIFDVSTDDMTALHSQATSAVPSSKKRVSISLPEVKDGFARLQDADADRDSEDPRPKRRAKFAGIAFLDILESKFKK